MIVEELINALKTYGPGVEVYIAQPTHNHWGEIGTAAVEEVSMQLVDHEGIINDDPDEEAYLYLVLGA